MKFPKIELPKFERKIKEADPPGVTVPAWLVRATKFASWVATFALIYFLWLYTLDVARDRAESLHLTRAGAWVGELYFWFPHIFGFAVVAFGIPYVAKIAIPTFVSLSWRDNFTAKIWSLVIAIAVSLVVISGTFAVQGHTIMERDRDAAVAVEQVQQGRSVIEAQIESKRQELADMMNNRNAYLAQAASVGAAEWQRSYIDATPANDPQRDRIVRALGAARAADTVREEIEALRAQLAQAPAVASVTREVVTEQTGWISSTLGWLEGVRAILLSFVMDIVALIMPLIALRLEQARNRQLGMAQGMAQHPWMLEDKRAEPAVQDRPARDAQDVADLIIAGGGDPRFAADMARSAADRTMREREMYDAQTGEKLVWRKGSWVKPPTRRGKGQEGAMDFSPEAPAPDETGVRIDGGNRIAVGADGLGGVMESADVLKKHAPDGAESNNVEQNLSPQRAVFAEDNQASNERQNDDVENGGVETADEQSSQQSEPSEMSEEDLAALYELAASDPEQSVDSEAQHSEAEQESEQEHTEPQTNPARLIAPVAAE